MPGPNDFAVIGFITGTVSRRNDPGVGMKMSRVGKPVQVRDLHGHQNR